MKPILVVLAAGMGSRYGGLKQMDPIDSQGHVIIDYSIFDAIRAGFGKVICIIKPELQEDFDRLIGQRLKGSVDLHYAYQRLDDLPEGFAVPEGRTKPWGTAHALLSAKNLIDAPFAVINADDFYGRTAFEAIAAFLKEPHADNEHAMVGYAVEKTLTENGSVARGVCHVEQGNLAEIVERTQVEPDGDGAVYQDGDVCEHLPAGTVVSMNLWGFQPSILREMEARFPSYLRENLPVNPMKCEYFLPLVPNALIREHKATIAVLPTSEKWYGVTYHEDKAAVCAAMDAMKHDGLYPNRLWGNEAC